MTDKEIQFRKKRELGDIITDSLDFLKHEIKPVLKLVIPYVVPFMLIYAALQVYVQMNVFGRIDFSNQEKLFNNLGPFYLNLLIVSLFSLFVQSLLAGTFYSYIEAYVKKGKGNFSPDEIKPELFSNTLLALGANAVLFVVTLVGVMMCILPGIYFANSLSLVLIIVLFERKGLSNAFTRSWRLVHTQWWNTFLLNLLGVVLVYAVGFVLSIPTMIAGVTSSVLGLQKTGAAEYPTWYWIVTGLSTVISSLFWIVPYTFLAFQFFNLDERTSANTPEQNL